MQTFIRLIAIAMLATACAATAPLARQVDRNIEFTGLLSGPGSEGLYVLVSGEAVYLADYAGPIRSGTNVFVRGKLQWIGDASTCPADVDCPYAAQIAHYFIEGAHVQVAP